MVNLGAVTSVGLASLRAITLNFRHAGLEALSRTAATADAALNLHRTLSAQHIASLVLATCNRTELYWQSRGPADDAMAAAAFRDVTGGPVREDGSPAHVSLTGEDAALHLFRVCCGLESLVIGEAEILGQVRSAIDTCTGAGPFLTGVAVAALRTGRFARAETSIAVGALSVASAAVQLLAGKVDVQTARVLVVGAGETGFKTARHLRARGMAHLVIANRTLARAEAAAAALGAEAVGLESVADHAASADAIVCAAGGEDYLLTHADLKRAAVARCGRPQVVVDLSMPPAVEPGEVPGLTRVDLQSIEGHVDTRRQRRMAEIPAVEAVIAREHDRLRIWADRRHARSVISGRVERPLEASPCP